MQFACFRHRRPDTGRVGEVHGDRVGGTAIGTDVGNYAVEGVRGTGSKYDGGSFVGEEPGSGRADPAACAGDEDDLAGQ
ncbi:hypothetical protein GCM10022222_31820 [Amycolatopsis ultiminotia]|uniref:Uncharacterized protein n=1 Tax=Amycolatopsis ultiminotia TaxID=543629 RepID=A0ABP6W3D1_9PSEU